MQADLRVVCERRRGAMGVHKAGVIALFDVDGTLTPPRKVKVFRDCSCADWLRIDRRGVVRSWLL